MKNTFGQSVLTTIFGESHGEAVGGTHGSKSSDTKEADKFQIGCQEHQRGQNYRVFKDAAHQQRRCHQSHHRGGHQGKGQA